MEEYLEDTKNILRMAGLGILKIYNGKLVKKMEKKDKSPVTNADFISQKIICEGIKKYGYKILSEEEENNSELEKEKFLWIVDPLDGTKDFIDRTGEFSIMLALVKDGDPIFGVVYKPIDDKMYFACKGKGSFLECEGKLKKIKTSDISDLAGSTLVMTRSHFGPFEELLRNENLVKKIIKVGSVGVKIGLISEGKAEIYASDSNKICKWDSAAPQIILQEAGGIMTDIKGNKIKYNIKGNNINGILAANNKKTHLLFLRHINKNL